MKKLLALLMVTSLVIASLGVVSFAAEPNINVYNGNYSGKVVVTDGNYNFLGGYVIAVEPNTEYIISSWAKGGGSVLMRLYDNNGWGASSDFDIWGGSDWTYRTGTITTREDVTSWRVNLVTNFYGGTGTKYVDDLFIAKASEPDVNLLPNSGFEEGAWSSCEREFSEVTMLNGAADPSVGELVPNDNVYNGHYSSKMTVSSYQQTGAYIFVDPNTDYQVTWYSKGWGAMQFVVKASSTESWGWGSDLASAGSKNGSTWQKNSFTFNSGECNLIVFVGVNNAYTSTGTGYIDDIVITKVSDGAVIANYDFENGQAFNGGIEGHMDPEYSQVSMVEGAVPVFAFTDLEDNTAKDLVVADGVKVTTEEEGVLVIAAYADDRLVAVKSGAGELSFTATELGNAEEVRAFLVDGISTLTPLAKAQSIYAK